MFQVSTIKSQNLYFSPVNPNLPPPHGAAPTTATLNKPPPAIFSRHRGRSVFGYAYPTYEYYKGVEKNKPEIEQLRFWCQSWTLVGVLTVRDWGILLYHGR